MSYFRTVELWTLIKKKPWRILFWTQFCSAWGQMNLEGQQSSDIVLKVPCQLLKLFIFLPPKHSFCLPSLSPESSNCLFAHCCCEGAVFLQIFFSNIKLYFLTERADFKFSWYFFFLIWSCCHCLSPWLCCEQASLQVQLCELHKYKKIALVLVYSFHYKSWRGHKEPSRKKGSSWWTSVI